MRGRTGWRSPRSSRKARGKACLSDPRPWVPLAASSQLWVGLVSSQNGLVGQGLEITIYRSAH